MATLITSIGARAFVSTDERRLAERLGQKLGADYLAQARKEGFAWGDMAVLCADTKARDLCARTLALRRLLVENRLDSGDFDPTSKKIKVMTMKVSKGLEFPPGGSTRRGAHACGRGGREGGCAGVLCGGDSGYAKVGFGSKRGSRVWIKVALNYAAATTYLLQLLQREDCQT